MNILEKIIQQKYIEVKTHKNIDSIKILEEKAEKQRPVISLKKKFIEAQKPGVIAEFKRKSPSKGIINSSAQVIQTTQAYTKAGAFALSVLTDTDFFGGQMSDLEQAAANNSIPVLRKDFIIDTFQILQARAAGASLILLIAANLSIEETIQLAKFAKKWNLEVLLEIHNNEELSHINEYIDFVGVNNRNLKTFEVSLNTSIELSTLIPNDFIKISESGIKTPGDVKYLWENGFKGFLIGENFMKTENPGKVCHEFIASL